MSRSWAELFLAGLVARLVKYLGTDGFLPVPGYAGDLRLDGPGDVEVFAARDGEGTVVVRYDIALESGGCDRTPPPEWNGTAACNLALVSAKSCEDASALGQHFWNGSQVGDQDPWASLRYTAGLVERPNHASRMHTVRLKVGLLFDEMNGRAVVLSDSHGVPAACGLLVRSWTSARFLNHHAVIILSSCAALGAFIFTLYLSVRHCQHNKHRALRRYTVRILLMVPIFTMEALVALSLHASALTGEVLKLVREVYESIVIFSFLQFIIVSVGGPKRLVARLQPAEGGEPMRLVFPWRYCVRPWRSAEQLLRWCILGTMSYVVIGLVVAFFGFALAVVPGVPKWVLERWLWLSHGMIGVGQFCAINALVELAEKNMEELRELKPLGKFLSVKLVVFFTFWQSLIMRHLVYKGLFVDFFDNQEKWGTEKAVGEGVLDVAVIFEMLVVSICHLSIFPPTDYLHLHNFDEEALPMPGEDQQMGRVNSNFASQALDVFNPADVGATVCPSFVQAICWWRTTDGTDSQGVSQRARTWFTSDGRRRTRPLCSDDDSNETSTSDEDEEDSSDSEESAREPGPMSVGESMSAQVASTGQTQVAPLRQ